VERTFRVNMFSYSWTTKAALAHVPDGGAVTNISFIKGCAATRA
jgi:NAD(P)-dependent dehydrogenase (short-subunit alcohol dehydrogenase family)